eukprot:6186879-Pleurochrysis_carterae.AAC.2
MLSYHDLPEYWRRNKHHRLPKRCTQLSEVDLRKKTHTHAGARRIHLDVRVSLLDGFDQCNPYCQRLGRAGRPARARAVDVHNRNLQHCSRHVHPVCANSLGHESEQLDEVVCHLKGSST